MFPDGAAGESSLSAAKGWVEWVGEEEAVRKFKEHEEGPIDEERLSWLGEVGCMCPYRSQPSCPPFD